jgi:S1-C subfamily serine protease
MDSQLKKIIGPLLALSILISGASGYVAGRYGAGDSQLSGRQGSDSGNAGIGSRVAASQEEQIIGVVRRSSPAVVSVIITKDLPVIEPFEINPFRDFFGGDSFFEQFRIPQLRQRGTEKREIGGGSGFILTRDGMVMTNRHVVEDAEAEYTVLTNEGEKLLARVLARHPVLDLAILKVDHQNLPTLPLGDSEKLNPGQSVIAIGNALGEFRNTVSAGVISGLRRTITTGDGNGAEELENVIQTDAAINRGNSGGPLLNLNGEVIGINVAVAVGAENIGFSVPINQAKKVIEEVGRTGRLRIPFLGARYVLINEALQRANGLPVNYGALLVNGSAGESAVTPNSAAAAAGLTAGDIILELDGKKINEQNSLAKRINEKNVGDEVTLKVLRAAGTLTLRVRLGER